MSEANYNILMTAEEATKDAKETMESSKKLIQKQEKEDVSESDGKKNVNVVSVNIGNSVTNVVPIDKLRIIQSQTLNKLKDYLSMTFGPMGSYTKMKYVPWITSMTMTSEEIFAENRNAILSGILLGIVTIVFIAIFIIVRIVLALVKIVSKLIDKIPGLKQINKLGGGICGAIEGIIIVYAIFAVISMISPIISNTIILEQIYNSNIGSIMYNNNMILKSIYKM